MNNLISNDLSMSIIAQAIEEMKSRQGKHFSIEKVNLAELERMTGIPRQRLRTLKKHGFKDVPHGRTGLKSNRSVLDGYTALIDNMLIQGITNSVVCHERLMEAGCNASLSTVKRYISSHKHLVPVKRAIIAPQGNRANRYITEPGEAYQMDWGFVKVYDYSGRQYNAACFAMICHHCGERYVEFFPNARQENLFIGMIHAFRYMGIPEYVLTDNMKSVVIKRDSAGNPVWQKDYEAFMRTLGFQTRLCKPRHPFTKGKVERLVRFVKDNFLAGRNFWNYSDLNVASLEWCNTQNGKYHREIDGIPDEIHNSSCGDTLHVLEETRELLFYLCPERCISFDGFINYEGRRFGVPFSYRQRTARVRRTQDMLYIYSSDLDKLLVTHSVTWSRKDRYCDDQFPSIPEPEEFPTTQVTTQIQQLKPEPLSIGFDKFNFCQEVLFDE